jgi:hypothetical protein
MKDTKRVWTRRDILLVSVAGAILTACDAVAPGVIATLTPSNEKPPPQVDTQSQGIPEAPTPELKAGSTSVPEIKTPNFAAGGEYPEVVKSAEAAGILDSQKASLESWWKLWCSYNNPLGVIGGNYEYYPKEDLDDPTNPEKVLVFLKSGELFGGKPFTAPGPFVKEYGVDGLSDGQIIDLLAVNGGNEVLGYGPLDMSGGDVGTVENWRGRPVRANERKQPIEVLDNEGYWRELDARELAYDVLRYRGERLDGYSEIKKGVYTAGGKEYPSIVGVKDKQEEVIGLQLENKVWAQADVCEDGVLVWAPEFTDPIYNVVRMKAGSAKIYYDHLIDSVARQKASDIDAIRKEIQSNDGSLSFDNFVKGVSDNRAGGWTPVTMNTSIIELRYTASEEMDLRIFKDQLPYVQSVFGGNGNLSQIGSVWSESDRMVVGAFMPMIVNDNGTSWADAKMMDGQTDFWATWMAARLLAPVGGLSLKNDKTFNEVVYKYGEPPLYYELDSKSGGERNKELGIKLFDYHFFKN